MTRRPDALCPLRPGQPCTLCHPEAKLGPQDCPTVAIVMDDPELRAVAARLRAEVAGRASWSPALQRIMAHTSSARMPQGQPRLA
jgi:hypothetical protein